MSQVNCPYKFTKIPRTGVSAVLQKIIEKNDKIVLFGFSITDETRQSYYVKDFVFEKEDKNISCHNKEDEVNIIRWLHENNKIDLTMCMLQDSSEVCIDNCGLVPSLEGIKRLNDIYGTVEKKVL